MAHGLPVIMPRSEKTIRVSRPAPVEQSVERNPRGGVEPLAAIDTGKSWSIDVALMASTPEDVPGPSRVVELLGIPEVDLVGRVGGSETVVDIAG